MTTRICTLAGGALVAATLLACAKSPQPAAPPAPAAPAEAPAPAAEAKPAEASSLYDLTMKTIEGEDKALADYHGKALLLVNTASNCGFTPQYAGLEKLYQGYRDRGLVVVAFPSNEYGGQEPGTAEEIKGFCEENFAITFPLMDKIVTKGEGIHPLYRWLTEASDPAFRGEIKWNFTKFLVDPAGRVVARFEPKVKPEDPAVAAAIEAALPKAP